MSQVEKISPQEAHKHVSSGTALLICAYESDEKFARFHLDGAIPLSQFESASATVPKDKELIFY